MASSSTKYRLVVSTHHLDAYAPREDRHYVNSERQWYGIFDGHGGSTCSEYVHKRLPEALMEVLDQDKKNTLADALCNTFLSVDEEFLHKYNNLKGTAIGSCGLLAAIQDDTIHVANVGDSIAIVGRRDDVGDIHAIQINNEHNTKNQKEVMLLKSRTSDPTPVRGSPNANTAGHRVGGVISVTRAFGDGIFKKPKMSTALFEKHLPYLTCEPEITTHRILPEDEFLLLASDGLFEQVTHEEVVGWIQEYILGQVDRSVLERTSEFIISRLYVVLADLANMTVEELKAMPNKKKMLDDTTVVVVFFR